MEYNNENEMNRAKGIVPLWQKYLLTFEEAAELSGLSEQRIRDEATKYDCPFIVTIGKTGKKKKIKRELFKEWLEEQTDFE